MKKVLKIIISLPKTFYYNFHFFKFKDAIKMPLLVSYNCKICGKRGSIILNTNKIKMFMIKIGYVKGSFNISEKRKTYIEINGKSTLIFEGNAIISKGSYICLNRETKISLGNDFSCNANCIISSQNSIKFGASCLIGWDCTIIDDDGHKTINSKKNNKNIEIGDHVWIAAKSSILKGSRIADGSIIGYGSIVSGNHEEKNILIAPPRAEKRKENIKWEK